MTFCRSGRCSRRLGIDCLLRARLLLGLWIVYALSNLLLDDSSFYYFGCFILYLKRSFNYQYSWKVNIYQLLLSCKIKHLVFVIN